MVEKSAGPATKAGRELRGFTMTIAAYRNPLDLADRMCAAVGRHLGKSFDWDAFPGSAGFPELARAQMRYIGAGGSPKADDPDTLKPGAFTLSLVHQPIGKYAACHAHEVAEHFLVLDGVLTVGWAFGDDVIEARLGQYDMVLNQSGRPHGFRNDGVGPVLMSISVGSGSPKPPVYACHPRDGDPERARRFGAAPGRTMPFDPGSDDPRHREFARHIVRHAEQRPTWQAGLARLDYIGGSGAPPGAYRMEMIHLPRGVAVRGYPRGAEEAYFVVDGALTVGWAKEGDAVEQRLGRHDVILTPAGRTRWFRNDGVADATFMLLSGGGPGDPVRFEPA
jgi:mannose-6-phosphate isomerase-like protein (cupin superfamily)